MEELSGGRGAAIYSDGEIVYRPLQVWSPTVHQVLNHLEDCNVSESPRFLGIDGKQEILSFIIGHTYNYPLVGAIATLEALASAAKLLRKIHDYTVLLLSKIDVSELPWMLEPQEPFQVICHGDFTPYNVVLDKNSVIGVFDFDTAHPAPRVWDLAYSIYCWAPFKTDNVDRLGTLEDQVSRARLFCDSYGASYLEREQLVDIMIKRLEALIRFMCKEASSNNEQFSENIEQGHLQAYRNDIAYIRANKQKIKDALCN